MPETDEQINLMPARGQAAVRTTEAFLRALGGLQVTLRISDPSTGDTSSQLGITAPTAEDIQIAPVLVQTMPPQPDGKRRWQLTFSARALRAAATPYGVTDIGAWLLGSQGLVRRGRLIPITAVKSDDFAGTDYLYVAVATE